MFVSKVIFELKVVDAYSIKDRRKIEKSLQTKLKNKFNVSIIIKHEDHPINYFELYISQINEQLIELDKTYEKILDIILDSFEVELLRTEFEILN